jgi:hypothetical protein
MAAASLLVRQAAARGVDVAVVQLVDRRQDPPGDAQEWTFQRDVEAVLYGNGYAQTTGAVYRLLQRSGVVRESLALKKACVQQGTVTQDEFDSRKHFWLVLENIYCKPSLMLVRLPAARAVSMSHSLAGEALGCFGGVWARA